MIRCIVIDDEPLAVKQLAAYFEKTPGMQLVATCLSTEEARKALDTESVDAMFIDINMPDQNGIDFVRSLTNPPLIVFTTAYAQYALEGFEVEAIDYLLKPFSLEDFQRAAARLKKQAELKAASTDISKIDDDNALFFKTEYKVVRVCVDNIRYVEAMSEYLRIHVDGHPRPVVVLLSMKKMLERLPTPTFMRIHRSYIINVKKIQEISRNHVIMDTDVSLPIGDLYKDTFNTYIQTKFLSK